MFSARIGYFVRLLEWSNRLRVGCLYSLVSTNITRGGYPPRPYGISQQMVSIYIPSLTHATSLVRFWPEKKRIVRQDKTITFQCVSITADKEVARSVFLLHYWSPHLFLFLWHATLQLDLCQAHPIPGVLVDGRDSHQLRNVTMTQMVFCFEALILIFWISSFNIREWLVKLRSK